MKNKGRNYGIDETDAKAYVAAYISYLREEAYGEGGGIPPGHRLSARFMLWFLGRPLAKGDRLPSDWQVLLRAARTEIPDGKMENLGYSQAADLVREFVRYARDQGYADLEDVHNEVVWFMLFMRHRPLTHGTGKHGLPSGWKYSDIMP